jgi:hypothetical protein
VIFRYAKEQLFETMPLHLVILPVWLVITIAVWGSNPLVIIAYYAVGAFLGAFIFGGLQMWLDKKNKYERQS